MYELSCPNCATSSHFDTSDFLMMCPFCSATFEISAETNRKEVFNDHFIVPNHFDATQIKGSVYEWLKRIYHKPQNVEKDFLVTNVQGFSVPHWIVSVEVHTLWNGIAERKRKQREGHPGGEFVPEKGTFRKSYRWAISARKNICEHWGMARLHEPQETLKIKWDGYPLDSTFSRGRLSAATEAEKSAFDKREFFEFKYANGIEILGVQVSEEEALRRARNHLEFFHRELASAQCDYLVDYRSELDIAGIQLLHLPFWHVTYVYKPTTALRHFIKPKEFHALFEGVASGVLKSEIPFKNRDKIWVNASVAGSVAILFFLVGAMWHPSFFLISLFFILVSGASAYVATVKEGSAPILKVKNDLG